MTLHRYITDMMIQIDGATVECDACIEFVHTPGFAGDLTDPPEPATVELQRVKIILPGREPATLGPASLVDALHEALQDDMFGFVEALAEETAEAKAAARYDD